MINLSYLKGGNQMTVQIKKCTTTDLLSLQQLSFITYTDTFEPFNTAENMKAYLDEAYADEKLLSELNQPLSEFYFLYEADELVGYTKLNRNEAQTEFFAENVLEIERLYVHPAHKRKGYGRFLMEYAFTIAQQRGNTAAWLGVWEHNESAKAFYETMGFKRCGQHSFFMGDDEQTDFIMMKQLNG